MGKVILLLTFFILTPTVLLIFLLYLYFLSQSKNNMFLSLLHKTPAVAYAALPSSGGILGFNLQEKDARIEAVREFLKKYNSVLEPFAQDIVYYADKYGLDFRLTSAIAMQESNLCTKSPKNSHNCWGFGVYGKKVVKFKNYKEALDTVTKTLAREYKTNGLETPEEIMRLYTPQSNGSWASSVSYFMNQIQ